MARQPPDKSGREDCTLKGGGCGPAEWAKSGLTQRSAYPFQSNLRRGKGRDEACKAARHHPSIEQRKRQPRTRPQQRRQAHRAKPAVVGKEGGQPYRRAEDEALGGARKTADLAPEQ